jgi:hypothetical protein
MATRPASNVKDVIQHAKKTEGGNGGIATLIPNHDTK